MVVKILQLSATALLFAGVVCSVREEEREKESERERERENIGTFSSRIFSVLEGFRPLFSRTLS